MAVKKGGLGKGLDSLIVNKNEGVVLANPEEHGAPVEVDIDNTGYLTPTASGTLTIENGNTVINYGDSTKTKTHILTFRATNGAQLVTNQKIDIDVEFRQGI